MTAANLPVVADANLEIWEEAFAKWLAVQRAGRKTRVSPKKQKLAASRFAERIVSTHRLNELKKKPAFQALYQSSIADIQDRALQQARLISNVTALYAMRARREAIREGRKELARQVKPNDKGGVVGDPLPALRVLAQLTNPEYFTVNPKKTEATVNQNVHVTLSAEQLTRLDAPETVIEATDVEYEIMPNEEKK